MARKNQGWLQIRYSSKNNLIPPHIMSRTLIFGNEARQKVLDGVAVLAKAVSATMGPKGRNVVVEKDFTLPMVTKDGVSVAKEVDLKDPFENLGAQLVREAATKTNDTAGDGTTTATVLAHSMMEEGMNHLKSGSNPILIKKGIDAAVVAVSEYLESIKTDVTKQEEYAAVATISAQDSTIGRIVAEVINKTGKNGVVTVEAGQTLGIDSEYVEGMQFDQGYISHYFVTDTERMEASYLDVPILITDKKINNFNDILPVLSMLTEKGQRELIIIAETVEGDALSNLIVNKMRDGFRCIPIKAPAFGDRRKDMLRDIAALTGGTVITEELGLRFDKVTPEHLGSARRVLSTKDKTLIVGGNGKKEDIDMRINEITTQLAGTGLDFDREKLQERLAKLSGGVGVIKVGAATEVEQKEKQHRVEDALSATRAAAAEGIVAGGGASYLHAIPTLKALLEATQDPDEKDGIAIVIKALESPTKCIAYNAGVEGTEVVAKIMGTDSKFGYNALTGKYEDLVANMVIDPKKVSRVALENAASAAGMFLTLEVAIINNREDKVTIPTPING